MKKKPLRKNTGKKKPPPSFQPYPVVFGVPVFGYDHPGVE